MTQVHAPGGRKCTSHWELNAVALALMAAFVNVVLRPQDNALLKALAKRRRALSGNQPVGETNAACCAFARPWR